MVTADTALGPELALWLDVEQFEQAVAEARLDDAASLWKGAYAALVQGGPLIKPH